MQAFIAYVSIIEATSWEVKHMNNRNNAWDLGRRTVAALTVVAASSGVVGLAQDVSQHKVLSPGNLVVSQ